MASLFITVALLLGNAFFVGSEFALIASRRTVIEPLAATSRRARWALSRDEPDPADDRGCPARHHHLLARPGRDRRARVRAPAGGAVPRRRPAGAACCTRSRSCSRSAWSSSCTPWSARWCRRTSPWPARSESALWLGPAMLAFCTATKPLLSGDAVGGPGGPAAGRIEATDAVKTVFTAEELAGLVGAGADRGPARPGGARPHHRRARAQPAHRLRRAAPLGGGDHGGRGRLAGVAGGARHPYRTVALPGGRSGPPGGCWASSTSRT